MAARWMQGLGRSALAVAWLLALAVPGLSPGDATAAEARGLRRLAVAAAAEDPDNARVIVKYRNGSVLARDAAGAPRHAARLGRQMTLALEDGHVLGRRTQSLRARGLSSSALAARLAANPEVEWAVPVRRKTISAVTPNDPYFADGQTSITPAAGQWYLRAPDATLVSAINAVGAWGITEGAASITVAVLDTGVRFDHPDFVKSGGSSKLWLGYDFVSRSTASNDGGGRDADASDPGDWSVSTDSCGAEPSSWHGTQVAGLIGAASDNGIGMASVGRNVMVLPVRVLGKCGGFDDDIIAGMRWAAGLSSDPVPNPNPARVINLSLGSSGACSTSYRDAVAELTAAGVAVVVAAGNDAGRAVNEPANCPGAIAVSGVRHAGSKVGYSNLGPEVALAAPAGNCVTLTAGACVYPLLTTVNAGRTAPGINTYSDGRDATLGTSFASPLVAGTVALMLSVDPRLTPAQIKTTLQATARVFPSTGAQEPGTVACAAPGSVDQIECYCTTSTCGAGLLDAGAAVAKVLSAVPPPSAVFVASPNSATVGANILLNAAGSSVASGRSIVAYRWELTSGANLAEFTGASDGSSATLVFRSAGSAIVRLTVTDSAGSIGSSVQTLVAVAAPVASVAASTTMPTLGNDVVLDSTGSTVGSGRSISSYRWSVQPGTGRAAIAGAAGLSTARLATLSPGTVTVQLTVTDSAGVIALSSVDLKIIAAPIARVSAPTLSPTVGTSILVTSGDSSSGEGRTIASYAWEIIAGATAARIEGPADQAAVSIAAAGAGNVTLRLTVTDSAGATSVATTSLSVVAAPQAMIFAPTSAPLLGTTITLDGRNSTAGNGRTLTAYRWVVLSGDEFVRLASAADGTTVSVASMGLGSAAIQLTVTDSAGSTQSATTVLKVSSIPPPEARIALVGNADATVGKSLVLDGTGSTATTGRSIQTYQWGVASGGTLANLTGASDQGAATLALTGVGDVVVTLTVIDTAGAASIVTKTIAVSPAPVVITASGGGGAMGGGWLLGLTLAIAGLARWPARRVG